MSLELTVGGTSYEFPENGKSAPWGEELTSWASAVTSVLGTLSSDTDILSSSFTLANNQTTPANIVGLALNVSLVRGAIIEYSIYRTSSTTTTDKAETGTIWTTWDGTSWSLARESDNETGVEFSVTAAGQFKYISTDIGSTSYVGVLKFSAKTKGQ